MRENMTLITVKLTTSELALLTALAADQLFRREFIDPKMPGYKSNSAETSQGKALVARLKLILDPASAKRTPAARMAG
jgi:hypothetical protein